MKPPSLRKVHLDAQLSLRSGEEELRLTSDRETVKVSLSSLRAFPQQPYSASQLWSTIKSVLPYLDQRLQVYLRDQLVVENKDGKWNIIRWADFLRLAWKALRS